MNALSKPYSAMGLFKWYVDVLAIHMCLDNCVNEDHYNTMHLAASRE